MLLNSSGIGAEKISPSSVPGAIGTLKIIEKKLYYIRSFKNLGTFLLRINRLNDFWALM